MTEARRPDPTLSARGIVAGYGDMQILHGVSVQIAAGEVVAVIGPNGSGKSTLMKTIAGLLRPWSGMIELRGADITGRSPRERLLDGVGYVPQTAGTFTNMNVAENLRMGARLFADGTGKQRETVLELLPALRERLRETVGRLSGGQQQMVAFGRALMAQPSVLLLDEPSGGLAPKVVDEVFQRVRVIADSGTAVLLIEQNVRKALEIADWAYVLADGANRLDGSASDILASDEVQRIYMGEY